MPPETMWYFIIGMVLGYGIGWFGGMNHGLAKSVLDMVETYKHLLDYGRPTKPVATATPAPPDAETRAVVQISEQAHDNLTEHISREANVSTEVARAEAELLLHNFETTGEAPT